MLNVERMEPTPTIQIPDHGFSALTPRQLMRQQKTTQFTPSTRKRIISQAQIDTSEGLVLPVKSVL